MKCLHDLTASKSFGIITLIMIAFFGLILGLDQRAFAAAHCRN